MYSLLASGPFNVDTLTEFSVRTFAFGRKALVVTSEALAGFYLSSGRFLLTLWQFRTKALVVSY